MGWHTSHCSLVKTNLSVGVAPAYLSNKTEYELIPDRRYRSPNITTPTAATPPMESTRILVGTLPAEAMATALAAFQASLILRFALTEAVAIFALVLFAVTVWPGTAAISKVQQQPDRDGGQSFLGNALLGLARGTAASAVIRT